MQWRYGLQRLACWIHVNDVSDDSDSKGGVVMCVRLSFGSFHGGRTGLLQFTSLSQAQGYERR